MNNMKATTVSLNPLYKLQPREGPFTWPGNEGQETSSFFVCLKALRLMCFCFVCFAFVLIYLFGCARSWLRHTGSSSRHVGSLVAACMWDLVPWLDIKPGPPALGAWSLNHWTTREVPGGLLEGDAWPALTAILIKMRSTWGMTFLPVGELCFFLSKNSKAQLFPY